MASGQASPSAECRITGEYNIPRHSSWTLSRRMRSDSRTLASLEESDLGSGEREFPTNGLGDLIRQRNQRQLSDKASLISNIARFGLLNAMQMIIGLHSYFINRQPLQHHEGGSRGYPCIKDLSLHPFQTVLHTHTLFTVSRYSTLKGDLEVIPVLKISPYIHSKQAVLHTHTLFTVSHYSTMKEDLEVIPVLKISPYTHSKQGVLHTHTLFTVSHYSTIKEDLEVIPVLKISPYIHSKQAVLHNHTLFTVSRYSILKEDLEVIPVLKISPYIHSKQAVLHTHSLFTVSRYSTLKEVIEIIPVSLPSTPLCIDLLTPNSVFIVLPTPDDFTRKPFERNGWHGF